jgi:drug/metabolite transporter (DMT)-like permease
MLATERVRITTSTLVFLRLAMISSAIFLFIINVALGISLKVPPGRSWAALFGLGLVSQLGGYLALTYALGHLPATAASISLLCRARSPPFWPRSFSRSPYPRRRSSAARSYYLE